MLWNFLSNFIMLFDIKLEKSITIEQDTFDYTL